MDILRNRQMPPPPMVVNNNQRFDEKEVLDLRLHQNESKYLIHWCKYNISECT